jgi:hypothetical protein
MPFRSYTEYQRSLGQPGALEPPRRRRHDAAQRVGFPVKRYADHDVDPVQICQRLQTAGHIGLEPLPTFLL